MAVGFAAMIDSAYTAPDAISIGAIAGVHTDSRS
ncbi:MAG: hypothetical protein ACI9OJ_000595, partial [Myxococcota bacterium]